MTKFQRVGATSNAHAGRDFECSVAKYLRDTQSLTLQENFSVPVGISATKKNHCFDLGCADQKVIVECKSHRWTVGGNVPSAKLTVWNEAMYYFLAAPDDYRKLFVVLKDHRIGTGETLAHYYCRIYAHLVPPDVEVWELDVDAFEGSRLEPQDSCPGVA